MYPYSYGKSEEHAKDLAELHLTRTRKLLGMVCNTEMKVFLEY